MKKLTALLLAAGLFCALTAPALAAEVVASPQGLEADGETVTCEMYNIDGSNYFKLRDLAALFNGTGSQFDVAWLPEAGLVSITTHHAYSTPDGHELELRGDLSATAQKSAQTIRIDGAERSDLSVWNIGGSNFFQLRELGRALGFAVDFDYGSNTAVVKSIDMPAHVKLVGMGETAFADLDDDGRDNAVRVWLEKDPEYGYWNVACLSIDGADLTDAMYSERDGNQYDAPDEFWWAVTDLDPSDGYLEIAIQDWGPSDDLTTSFFRFDGKELHYLGAPEGFLYFQNGPASMTLNGDGTLRSQYRLNVLQTWWSTVTYAPGVDGKLAVVPQDFYPSTFSDQPITLTETLCAYDAPDGSRSVLPAGTQARLVGTDDAEWIRLQPTEGGDAWLHLTENGFSLEAPKGAVNSWDALSDLFMAD